GVLGFALALSTAVGVCFGLAPALAASRVRLSAAMQSGGRGAAGDREARRLREGLVIAEITLAAVLLFGAGLLARSFWRLTHVDSGLVPDSVLSLSITIPAKYLDDDGDRMAAYRSAVLDAVRALPGVTAAGASKTLPLEGGGEAYGFTVEGRGRAGKVDAEAGSLIISTGYFGALGIPILRGRDLTEADLSSSAPVLLINQALARRIFHDQDPVGRGLILADRWRFEIIGVVGNVRHGGLAQAPTGAIYVPMSRFPRSSLKIFVRSSGDPTALASGIRSAIRRLEPEQPISRIAPLRDLVSSNAARPRLLALLVGAFSAAALLLAALGIYGVISYGVALRTREIGVRMALGADRAAVQKLIVREGMRLAASGLLAGAAAAWALSRGLRGLLFEVRPADPVTIGGVALFLTLAALLACLVPARRAARLDPQTALRAEG
ncbi:MAG: FtsX-like permease family protein, partial [Thermoanaerobaculia bacterium]